MKLKDSDILFEDNHLLAVVKEAPLLTQPDASGRESLEILAKEWLQEKYQKKGNVFLHAVHRLDKEVSGIILFAKSQKALSRLNESQRAALFTKIYLAKVEGTLPEKEGELVHFLIHGDHKAIVAANGKEARLHYKVQEGGLVEILLTTGRYHQIRAQLSAVGCPIIGDGKYGSKNPSNAICLHHAHLRFPHPTKGEIVALDHLPSWASS